MEQTQAQITIELLQETHYPQLQWLMNQHLSTLAPGWALPEHYIVSRLSHNPDQYSTDPWVSERMTLCAILRQRVVGVAHLLRYKAGPEVSGYCQNAGEIDWFLAVPHEQEAAEQFLAACQRQFATWQVRSESICPSLPVGPFVGVPDVWPHISSALERAGYWPDPEQIESIYEGTLDHVSPPGPPPVEGMTLQRTMGHVSSPYTTGVCFSALVEGERVGYCEIDTDLTRGGTLPSLHGWAELSEVFVEESWRRRGIATWLIQHAVAWHRPGGGTRMILSVEEEDEESAGRLYRGLGWQPFAKQKKVWKRDITSKQ
jgi:GNAT superfamily N-acetyltransferase